MVSNCVDFNSLRVSFDKLILDYQLVAYTEGTSGIHRFQLYVVAAINSQIALYKISTLFMFVHFVNISHYLLSLILKMNDL